MTSWVIVIRRGNEEHWDIAQKYGYWDMLKTVPIQPGDYLYFWQSGRSFVGRALAGRQRPITREDEHPWNDDEDYTTRVAITAEEGMPVHIPRWSDVETQLGSKVPLRGHVPRFEGTGEEVLAGFFGGGQLLASYRDADRQGELESLGFDLREFDMRAIARRQGQSAFRNQLLSAYGERCAISGSATLEVLEAAHISPYRGVHTNLVSNGLLLRSDLHTLFDLQRLTVLPNLTVSVHPDLRNGDYRHVHGSPLTVVPRGAAQQPKVELLRQHNERCGWVQRL